MADMVSSRYDHSAGRVLPGVCTLYAGLYGVTCRSASPAAPVLRTVSSTQRTQRAVGRHRAGMRHHGAHAATCVGADAGRRRTPVAETTAVPVPRPQPIRRASGFRKSRKGHNEHINRTPAPRRQRAGRHETRHRRGVFGHPDVPRHPVGSVAEHRLLHTDGGILDQRIGRAMADHRLPAVAAGVDPQLAVHGAQIATKTLFIMAIAIFTAGTVLGALALLPGAVLGAVSAPVVGGMLKRHSVPDHCGSAAAGRVACHMAGGSPDQRPAHR